MRTTVIYGIIVFLIAFYLGISLVDKEYKYTFEPDSEGCVEEVKTFYYFFKSPSAENFPHHINTYPNYFDGAIIYSALVANAMRPLCHLGILPHSLNEGDNSLFIFSIRWGNVLLDAIAVALAYFALVLITQNTVISLIVILMFFLVNPLAFSIDFMRVDHYASFSGRFVRFSALFLFFWPHKKRYYILTGIAAAMAFATKINFPFFLVPFILIALYLAYTKKLTRQNIAIFLGTFLLVFAFLFQRWIAYYEEAPYVLKATMDVAESWIQFWELGDGTFYHWEMFLPNELTLPIIFLLVFAYTSFLVFFIKGIKSRDPLTLILAASFFVQSFLLLVSPKVERYGRSVPIWVALFVVIGLTYIYEHWKGKIKTAYIYLGIGLIMLPVFVSYAKNYLNELQKCNERTISITQTRIPAKEWVEKNIALGSAIAIQHPRLSNPPIFQRPYQIDQKLLEFNFLNKEKLLSELPPDLSLLKQATNYVILNDKETNYRYSIIENYNGPPKLIKQWKTFYQAIDSAFPHTDFVSEYTNYGVKALKIYHTSDSVFGTVPVISNCQTTLVNEVTIKWQTNIWQEHFEVQIATDSSFNWLILGNRNGFPSKYHFKNDPTSAESQSYLPPIIEEAIKAGKFKPLLGNKAADEVIPEVNGFFKMGLLKMTAENCTFAQYCQSRMDSVSYNALKQLSNLAYDGNCPFWERKLPEYLNTSGLKININDMHKIATSGSEYRYKPCVKFKKGQTYFWRVRAKKEYEVHSDWSATNSFGY